MDAAAEVLSDGREERVVIAGNTYDLRSEGIEPGEERAEDVENLRRWARVVRRVAREEHDLNAAVLDNPAHVLEGPTLIVQAGHVGRSDVKIPRTEQLHAATRPRNSLGVLSRFRRLQLKHAVVRFDQSFVPPRFMDVA